MWGMDEAQASGREHAHHPRTFEQNRYVYAVLSRRAGGISIGVNLNPDKHCNLDCIYCQVDRTALPAQKLLDVTAMATLTIELAAMLKSAAAGSLFALPRFADLPEENRVIRDVAISGDGEPTSVPGFSEIVSAIVSTVQRSGVAVPVTLITNAAGLDRAGVKEGVRTLMDAGGQIWAKLDAGTESYYKTVCATQVPFAKIIENITNTAKKHPITLQTCLIQIEGAGPSEAEIAAYIRQVNKIAKAGTVAGIQLYTMVRAPARSAVSPLPKAALAAIGKKVREALPGLPVDVYP